MKRKPNIRTMLFLLALGSLFTSCYNETEDLARFYNSALSPRERDYHSYYNWEETKTIKLEFTTQINKLVKLRALNGEILYQGYLETGILSEFSLAVPEEIDQILIEYDDKLENISIGEFTVRFAF